VDRKSEWFGVGGGDGGRSADASGYGLEEVPSRVLSAQAYQPAEPREIWVHFPASKPRLSSARQPLRNHRVAWS
jgi:hypothetical protein